MSKEVEKRHESYGMIVISRFVSNNAQFFGSDLVHNGGISIVISNAKKTTKLNSSWYLPEDQLIRVELSNNQFIDAITSEMNTTGVPCTIKRYGENSIEQINHVEGKKEEFSNNMEDVHVEYTNRINDILKMLDGNVGKRKAGEIKHELEVLRSHICSNTNFVMTCFNEAMEKSVTEAKHSIANYIDHKIHTLGVEKIKGELEVSIENKELRKLNES